MTRDDCVGLDRQDPLATHRGEFALPAGVIYLDGDSLTVRCRSLHATALRRWSSTNGVRV